MTSRDEGTNFMKTGHAYGPCEFSEFRQKSQRGAIWDEDKQTNGGIPLMAKEILPGGREGSTEGGGS